MNLIIILLVMLLMTIFGGLFVRDSDNGMAWAWGFIIAALFIIGWFNHIKTMSTFEENIRREAVLRGHAVMREGTTGGVFMWFNIGECKHYEELKK